MRQRFGALALAAALALGAAPGTARGQADAPNDSGAYPAGADPAGAARRAAAVAIAVGDRVRVKVWREPTFGDEQTVDERGNVTLPRLGVVRVAGHSIAATQDTLRARFADYLRNPSVSVNVLRRVGVQGEVRAPNVYYIDVTMTLRDVLAQAGGITELGNPNDVAIVRDGRTVRLGRWRDVEARSVDLRSGDQVIVGRTSWLSRNALAVVSTVGFVVTVGLQVINARR
jgi:polysaccharide export outer membrane protein